MTEAAGPSRPSPAPVTTLAHLEETVLATQRYLATLARLTSEELHAPSLLPGWTRGHVVTHLARNADGLVNLLHWARTGEPTPMYASQEQRDDDIAAGADRSAEELVADAADSAARFEAAARGLPADRLDAQVSRTLGAPTYAVRRVGTMRRTEVEVHHADLDVGYTAHDWPADLVDHLVARRCAELGEQLEGQADAHRFTLELDDRDSPVRVGPAPEAVVSGLAADAVWWLLGRGSGEGLRCSTGRLPELGRWV